MPARHIRPSHQHTNGRVATNKVSYAQEFESLLEKDFMLLLEFDKGVYRYTSQPITIRWNDGSRQRRYTPDILVEYTPAMVEHYPYLKPTLFEVKPENLLKQDWATLKPKFRAAVRWCREYECRFRIVTERYIRTPYLGNLKFLRQFSNDRLRLADSQTIAETQAVLRSVLFETGRTTPLQLLDSITLEKKRRAELLPYMWHLIRCGAIGVDLQQPLTMQSPIWSLEAGTQLAMTLGGRNRTRIINILDDNNIRYSHE